ncbi:hypothetical protein KSF78_0003104 [Schistosoma japonicum]|nr:hypothetical protein KSF78_0003104 [Schistosoma japonicum]
MNVKNKDIKKCSLRENRGLLQNIRLCEKIMIKTLLKEKETPFSDKQLVDKVQRGLKSNSFPSSAQKKVFSGNPSKSIVRHSNFDKRVLEELPNSTNKSLEQNMAVLLSHILIDGSIQSIGQKQSAHSHVFSEVPEQIFIQNPNIPVNINPKETCEVINQSNDVNIFFLLLLINKSLDGSVETISKKGIPISKSSKSVQCSVDKPTSNIVAIQCDIISVIKNNGNIALLDENSKLIAQQKAQIEHLKQTLLSQQNQVRSLSSQLCNKQLEFDKAKLNWLQKENRLKVEKYRIRKKCSTAIIAKEQVAKNLEISRGYIKHLKDHISMLQQSQSDVRSISRNSKHFSIKKCGNFLSESTYSKEYVKNIDLVRSTPDVSATFPTISKLLSLSKHCRDPYKCVTPKVLANHSCQIDREFQHCNCYDGNQLPDASLPGNHFDGALISANPTLSCSMKTRKASTNHEEISNEPDDKYPSISSIASSVSSLQMFDEMEFQDNLALLDQRINNVREYLRLNPMI